MDNFSVPSGSLPPIPPTVGNNNVPVAPPIVPQTPPPTPAIATPTPTPTVTATVSAAPSVPVAKILLAVIPFFAFIVTGAISYNLMNQPQTVKYLSRAAAEPTTAPITLSSAQTDKIGVAKKVLDWINKQQDPSGLYYLGKFIVGGKEMEPTINGGAGMFAIWAKYAYWQKTKDQTVLNSLIADLDSHIDVNKLPVTSFQPDYWNCKLLNDLAQDTSLPPEVSAKAKSLCLKAIIGRPAPADVNPSEPSASDLESTFQTVSNKENISPNDEYTIDKQIDIYSSFSSDHLFKNLMQSDASNITKAKESFNAALKLYQRLVKSVSNKRQCVLGVSAVDLYNVTKDSKYLEFAKSLFDKNKTYDKGSLFKKVTCLLFAQQLNADSPDQKYTDFVNQIFLDIQQSNYDPATNSYFTKAGNDTLSYLMDNGMMVTIILK